MLNSCVVVFVIVLFSELESIMVLPLPCPVNGPHATTKIFINARPKAPMIRAHHVLQNMKFHFPSLGRLLNYDPELQNSRFSIMKAFVVFLLHIENQLLVPQLQLVITIMSKIQRSLRIWLCPLVRIFGCCILA